MFCFFSRKITLFHFGVNYNSIKFNLVFFNLCVIGLFIYSFSVLTCVMGHSQMKRVEDSVLKTLQCALRHI